MTSTQQASAIPTVLLFAIIGTLPFHSGELTYPEADALRQNADKREIGDDAMGGADGIHAPSCSMDGLDATLDSPYGNNIHGESVWVECMESESGYAAGGHGAGPFFGGDGSDACGGVGYLDGGDGGNGLSGGWGGHAVVFAIWGDAVAVGGNGGPGGNGGSGGDGRNLWDGPGMLEEIGFAGDGGNAGSGGRGGDSYAQSAMGKVGSRGGRGGDDGWAGWPGTNPEFPDYDHSDYGEGAVSPDYPDQAQNGVGVICDGH